MGHIQNNITNLIIGIRERRKALCLTQAEVAERAGIRQSNYSRMESGRQTPNLETLYAVLDVLDMRLALTPEDGTIYHIMLADDPVTDVFLSKDKKKISFIKHEPDGIRQPFSGTVLDLERFYRFLKSRCYEDTRADLKDILQKAGLKNNNPYDWVRLTHGVTYEDFFWIRFDDETISWSEVRIR